MKRLSPCLLAILVFTGCHAPMPSFNLLAPYGPTRIPPAATSRSSTYYQGQQGSSTAPVGTGFRTPKVAASRSTDLSSITSPNSSGAATGDPDNPGRTILASHETISVVPTTLVPANTVVQSRGPIQIVDAAAPRTLPANVRGMHINEAAAEPNQFFPGVHVIDITQLPPASSVRYANVVPVNQAVGTSVAQASTNLQVSSSGSSTGGTGWHSRN